MKRIRLTQGKYVLVDDEDFEWLNKQKWCITAGYASCRKNNKILYMHRYILNAKDNEEIDHINNDILDNRKVNLRKVNRSQNMANTKLRKVNKSGYKGVIWDKARKKWAVEITVNYKKIHLGRYLKIKDAIKIYNQAAKKYFGEFAYLNRI